METVNHECYVSLEIAKLLKEAGFDWKCIDFYDILDLTYYQHNKPINWNGETDIICSRPTLDVAQRWLREVKNCYAGVEVFVHDLDKNNIYYTYNWAVYFNGDRYSGSDYDTTRYYEVAQEASIKKALKIILNIKKALEIILEKGE